MSPKKSAAGSGKKTSAKKPAPKKSVPKAPSPMRKIEHAVGPNPDGLAHQAREAHRLPEPSVPARARSKAAANAPAAPDTSTAGKPPVETTTVPDKGKER